MFIPSLIFVLIWCIVALVILIVSCYWGIRFMLYRKSLLKKAHDDYEKVKESTQNKFNKVATLSPRELNIYLSKLYSIALILQSVTDISEKDTMSAEKLLASSIAKMLSDLRPETVSAIDYYYGNDYVITWCASQYRYLENLGILSAIIAKNCTVDRVYTELTRFDHEQH